MIDKTWTEIVKDGAWTTEDRWAWEACEESEWTVCKTCGEVVLWEEIDPETGSCRYCGETDE